MSIRMRLTALGGALVLAAGLSAGIAATAGAAITPATTLLTTSNGEAGYGTAAPAGKTFQDIQAVTTADQYGTTVQGGAIGVQLSTRPGGRCLSNAAQLGLVANTATSTYNVECGPGFHRQAARPARLAASSPRRPCWIPA